MPHTRYLRRNNSVGLTLLTAWKVRNKWARFDSGWGETGTVDRERLRERELLRARAVERARNNLRSSRALSCALLSLHVQKHKHLFVCIWLWKRNCAARVKKLCAQLIAFALRLRAFSALSSPLSHSFWQLFPCALLNNNKLKTDGSTATMGQWHGKSCLASFPGRSVAAEGPSPDWGPMLWSNGNRNI